MAQTYLPTLKQLQYLIALKDHGHFGRAAEGCYVTQSTLSAGILFFFKQKTAYEI